MDQTQKLWDFRFMQNTSKFKQEEIHISNPLKALIFTLNDST